MAIRNDTGTATLKPIDLKKELSTELAPLDRSLGIGLQAPGGKVDNKKLETLPLSIELHTGDDFRTGGLETQGLTIGPGISTDPLSGAFGFGRPTGPLGGPLPAIFTGVQAKRVESSVFEAAHRGNPIMSRPIVADADHYAPAERQTWVDIGRQVYGPQLGGNASEETLALLGEALAQLNGRSNLEAPPSVVAVPDLRDVNRFLTGLKRDLKAGPPVVRPAVARFGGESPTPQSLPTPGHSYEARWNDTLRGVALHAYGAQLHGLNPEEADAKLQTMMMVIARVNELNTTDLRDAGVIWIPSPPQIAHALSRLEQPDHRQRVQQRNPALSQSIERTGRDAMTDLSFNELRDITPATAPDQMSEVIDSTDSTVRSARFDRVLEGPSGYNFWGVFSWNLLFEYYPEEPPDGDELPFRRSYETLENFLDRVAPNLPPEEYRRVLENPGSIMMRAAGLMNGNGEFDEGKKQEFMNAMQTLGLVDSTGAWVVADPEPNESAEAYADRVSIEAARRAGIPVEYQEGDNLECAFYLILAEGNPEEKALVRNLVIWNQLVVLGAEAPGESSTGGPKLSSGPPNYLDGLFGNDMFDLFVYGGYMPPPVEIGETSSRRTDAELLLEGWDNVDIVDEEKGFLDTFLDGDSSEQGDFQAGIEAMEAKAQAALAELQLSVNMNPDERRRAEKTYKLAVEALAHAKAVSIEAIEANLDVNRGEAEGKPIGGPGWSRNNT